MRTLIYTARETHHQISFPFPSLASILETAQEVKELSLTFSNGLPSSEGYCAILALCPHLTMLQIQHSGTGRIDGNILLPELVLNDSKEFLCPYLESFWCSSPLFVTPEILFKFVFCTRRMISYSTPWKALDISETVFDLANTAYDHDMIAECSNKLKAIQSISATRSFPFNQQLFWDQVRVYSHQASINHFLR